MKLVKQSQKFTLIIFAAIFLVAQLNFISCTPDEPLAIQSVQKSEAELNSITNELVQNDDFAQYVLDRFEFIKIYGISLQEASDEKRNEINAYNQAVAQGSIAYDEKEAMQIYGISPQDMSALTKATEKVKESTTKIYELLKEKGLLDQEMEIVLQNIASSETHMNTIEEKLNGLDMEYMSARSRKERRCTRRFRWCLIGRGLYNAVIAAGCLGVLWEFPPALIACLTADGYLISSDFNRCLLNWYGCMGISPQ